eukprot:GHVP01069128.1.p1 GENE.GHVP01069128.1~~GHVP01069128.1.p1  ORF type:complete len:295 (+),score=69.13 GHVP01069128.1:31-915(+)
MRVEKLHSSTPKSIDDIKSSPRIASRLHSTDEPSDEQIRREIRESLMEKEEAGLATQKVSDSLKVMVFGGLDGIVTIFTVVAGSVGASLTPAQIFIVGIGNLVGDAISMGFGEYTSTKAEEDFMMAQRKQEEWELETVPHIEKAEMMEIYIEKHGFSPKDALAMITLVSKYPEFYVSHMMVEELGLLDGDSGLTAIQRGIIMSFSFLFFGSLPLIGFLVYYLIQSGVGAEEVNFNAFLVSAALSLTSLFFLGTSKSFLVGESKITPGLQMMLNGSIAGGFAYGLGVALNTYVLA